MRRVTFSFVLFTSYFFLFPLQRPLLKDVHQADEEHGHEGKHFEEAKEAEFFEVDGPGVHENDLHIEQNEEDGHEEIFYGKGAAGVANGRYATLKGVVLDAGLALGAEEVGSHQGCHHETYGDEQDHENGKIRIHISSKLRGKCRYKKFYTANEQSL